MDAKLFKAAMKQVIKESLREILAEEGLLQTISEAKHPVKTAPKIVRQLNRETAQDLNNNRKKLEESFQNSRHVAPTFNPFEGTQALTEGQVSDAPKTGPLKNIDPSDSGVDVSSLIGGNKKLWNALLTGGKKK
jgi:hypothetical protein